MAHATYDRVAADERNRECGLAFDSLREEAEYLAIEDAYLELAETPASDVIASIFADEDAPVVDALYALIDAVTRSGLPCNNSGRSDEIARRGHQLHRHLLSMTQARRVADVKAGRS